MLKCNNPQTRRLDGTFRTPHDARYDRDSPCGAAGELYVPMVPCSEHEALVHGAKSPDEVRMDMELLADAPLIKRRSVSWYAVLCGFCIGVAVMALVNWWLQTG